MHPKPTRYNGWASPRGMVMTAAIRRELDFDSLDAAVRDAEHLHAVGYDKAGNWDLAQCVGHLAKWVSYPMDGFPPTPLLMRPIGFVVRNTVGGMLARKYMRTGKMMSGAPALPESVLPPGGDPAAAIENYRAVVARFLAFDGSMKPSPFFRKMSHADAVRLHTVHAAHHLSFLVPRG